jgi:hypothetical protein
MGTPSPQVNQLTTDLHLGLKFRMHWSLLSRISACSWCSDYLQKQLYISLHNIYFCICCATHVNVMFSKIRDWGKRVKSIKNNSVAWVRERTIPTERPPLSAKWLPTFADRGCHVVSVTDP